MCLRMNRLPIDLREVSLKLLCWYKMTKTKPRSKCYCNTEKTRQKKAPRDRVTKYECVEIRDSRSRRALSFLGFRGGEGRKKKKTLRLNRSKVDYGPRLFQDYLEVHTYLQGTLSSGFDSGKERKTIFERWERQSAGVETTLNVHYIPSR